MAKQEDKPGEADPPAEMYAEEMYAIVPPDPDLAGPTFPPIIPEVVSEDGSDADRATGGRFDAEGFREGFRFQFTLSDLFILTTALSVLLGIMSLLNWQWGYAAGLAGVAAFVSLLVIIIGEPERRGSQIICWGFLVAYVLICIVALVVGELR